MIDALMHGRLCGAPGERTSKAGRAYATAKVRTVTGDGESMIVNVVAFSDSVIPVLLALREGDALAIAGEFKPKVWVARDGVHHPGADVVAHQVTTVYHVSRRRHAILQGGDSERGEDSAPADDLLDDPLPPFRSAGG